MVELGGAKRRTEFRSEAERAFGLAAAKTRALAERWPEDGGAPVFTVDGRYTLRGWTEWTQGFQFGNSLLVYEATGESWFLDYGKKATLAHMAPHLTHFGVHDHGFNNISTYGNLSRMLAEGTISGCAWEKEFYRLALKVSGAVQAARWTHVPEGLGFIYSFNGAHSLFADTIRSLRSLAVAHSLGQHLAGEQDKKVSLLARLLRHAETTARFNVYFGAGRDRWDIRGRVAHESIFNVEGGSYRCPSTQQGYSAFSTWTRGLAWIILGYAEELEYLGSLDEGEFPSLGLPYAATKAAAMARFEEVTRAVCDFYIENTPPDGVPYWDTGAPNLWKIEGYLDRPADPYNPHEPVDSSAAAIAAQGFLRFADHLAGSGRGAEAARYEAAGLRLSSTLFAEPYLSADPSREGLLLHAVYHLPNGWDHSPDGSGLPRGESCMWGDYHLLELALYLLRCSRGGRPQRFFDLA